MGRGEGVPLRSVPSREKTNFGKDYLLGTLLSEFSNISQREPMTTTSRFFEI